MKFTVYCDLNIALSMTSPHAEGVCMAGLKKGILDDRSGLIKELFRLIDEDEEAAAML